MQRSGRSQKNDDFCPNKVLVDLFVCLFEVCEHWTEQTRVPADMI